MWDQIRVAWRPTRRSAQEREQLTPARWAVIGATTAAFLGLLAVAPVDAAQRASVGALWLVTVGAAAWLDARRERVAGRTAVRDLVGAVSAVATLAIAPDAWPLALCVAFIWVVAATARGGFAVGVPVLLVVDGGLLVVAWSHGLLVPGWGFVALLHALTSVTLVASVALSFGDQARLDAGRDRIEDALTAFGRVAVDGDPTAAVAAAIGCVLHPGSVLSVDVHTQGEDDWATPGDDVTRRVRLVSGPAGGLVVEVWLAMVAGQDTVGHVTVQLRERPSDDEMRALDLLADRLAVAVLAQQAHHRERAARLELERAESVRDEVLARVTHDLRAPLSTITGSVYTLLEHGDSLDAGNTRMLYELLGRNADRVTNWVQSLLEGAMHGERTTIDPVPVPLADLLRDGAETAAHHLAEHELVVRAATCTVLADSVAVTRVLANLLGNAAKYAPPGTRIELTAEEGDEHVTVAVVDHGAGMAPDTAAHVFEPFYRAPDQPEGVHGTGLGLATVRDLVLAWGGRVGVRETAGGGASFWFTLPLAEAAVEGADVRRLGS